MMLGLTQMQEALAGRRGFKPRLRSQKPQPVVTIENRAYKVRSLSR